MKWKEEQGWADELENDVGHFLWTNLLMPRVLATGPHARIVKVASTAHTVSETPLDNYNWDVRIPLASKRVGKANAMH